MTFNERLQAFFIATPNVWIDGRELSKYGGSYGWRTRLSNLRLDYGMTIENRQVRHVNASGAAYVTSEYRYVPKAASSADVYDANRPFGLR